MSSDSQQGHGVHFFKVILESSLREGELSIPRSFVRKYWQGVSNPIFLRLPNGTKWKVNWIKRDGDVWLTSGWRKFAEYLSLDQPQFLVFRYERNSHFQVIIFGPNALEIDYSLLRGTDEVEEVEESDDNSLEIVDDVSPCHGKRPRSPLHFSQTGKKMKMDPKGEPEGNCSPQTEIKGAQSKTKKHWRKKSYAGTRKAEERARAFSSEKPHFRCQMGRTYTTRDIVIIPNDFAKTYLHKRDGPATLWVNQERTWNVMLKLTPKQSTICAGWKKFFANNDGRFGDFCVFELNMHKGVSFRVIIYRASEESSTPLSQDQKGLSHRPSSSLRNPESTHFDFTLYIKHTRLQYVNIPFNFFRPYIRDSGRDVTLLVGRRSWNVKVLCYPNHSCAKFSVGWNAFVSDCKLKDGDACHFELIDEENLVLKVTF